MSTPGRARSPEDGVIVGAFRPWRNGARENGGELLGCGTAVLRATFFNLARLCKVISASEYLWQETFPASKIHFSFS